MFLARIWWGHDIRVIRSSRKRTIDYVPLEVLHSFYRDRFLFKVESGLYRRERSTKVVQRSYTSRMCFLDDRDTIL